MNEHSELLPNLLSEDTFEVQMRGYSRRQVDEYVARTRSQTRDLEERLARSLDDAERLRAELSAARQQAGAKAPHEEVSERMAQILNLAHEEAGAQKARANEEIEQLRNDAQRQVDKLQTEAREQAERTLNSAQEQAEQLVAAARAEADRTRQSARAEAERATATVRKEADEVRANANAKAERMLAEATARADAINDGASRRLELLSGTHAEAARRLTEIRDVVTDLLRQDSARGSLEDEVSETVATAMRESARPGPASPDASRAATPPETVDPGKGGRQAGARSAAKSASNDPYGTHDGPAGPGPGPAGSASPAGGSAAASSTPGGSAAGGSAPGNSAPGGSAPGSPRTGSPGSGPGAGGSGPAAGRAERAAAAVGSPGSAGPARDRPGRIGARPTGGFPVPESRAAVPRIGRGGRRPGGRRPGRAGRPADHRRNGNGHLSRGLRHREPEAAPQGGPGLRGFRTQAAIFGVFLSACGRGPGQTQGTPL